MNREELKEYVGTTAFSLGHVEKDYIQHIVLGSLSRNWSGYLVFKGGTALQKIGLVNRFSEDLDFTEKNEISPNKLADTVVKAIESYNFPVEVDEFSDKEITSGFRVKVEGPLYRNNRGVCSIRLQVSRREEVLKDPIKKEIDPPYRDVLPYVIKVMDKDEIAAEKVRAILTRDKVRDVYDLYKLIENDAGLDRDMIEKKLGYYEMELERSEFIQRVKELSKRWDTDLRSLMDTVPEKEKALETLTSEMKAV
ncbi:MAG: nucleotidyl transferase AbiEii/AbiGii toxin family protein [Candidatus Thermoplasmatota archaeon]